MYDIILILTSLEFLKKNVASDSFHLAEQISVLLLRCPSYNYKDFQII
jgi:hypothetical protein